MTNDPHQVLYDLEQSYRHICHAIDTAKKMRWRSEERKAEHTNYLLFVQEAIKEEIVFYRTELRKR